MSQANFIESAYEELLRESCQTIVGLRSSLHAAQQENLLLLQGCRSLTAALQARPELDCFDDSLLDDAWDWPEEYETRCCGAPCSRERYENGGRCGQPCI